MIEQILFGGLLLLALVFSVRTIAGRFTALKGKPWLRPDNIPQRIRRVFMEVILQQRVVRGRPLVGIMHALVMFGFVAFAWISLKHCLIGFGWTLESSNGWYGTYVAVWASLTMLGILGLAFRRFVIRPKELGHLSATSGIVAFLIVILMTTYLLDWGWFHQRNLGWKINWWIHTSALLGMFVIIPRSKHLHLLLSPFAIFLRSETTSSMRSLDFEKEELGLTKFSELGAKDILDVNACVECGRCTAVCPANLVGKSLNPKEIILQLQRGLLSGGEIIAGTAEEVSEKKAFIRDEDIFQCLSCGACEQACPVGIEHVGMKILDIRRGLVSEERFENSGVDKLFQKMMKPPHNPWGFPQSMRESFVQEQKFPVFNKDKEWLFWLGCGNSFDPHGQEVAKAMGKILDAAWIKWGVLENETCCGEPARRAGNEMLFLELSEKMIATFKKQGVKKIVTCCPHCTTMFDKDYRQIPEFRELGITVTHHSELIATLLPQLNIQKFDLDVTFHDSCYMARGRNVISEPRQILKACGAKLKEMGHNKKETFCCGAGGAQIFIAEDKIGQRANTMRFAEAHKTEAKVLAVECPYCPVMFKDAADKENPEMEILDIAEIVAARLKAGCAC